ncbi:hypothetical protein GEV33_000586 [Tenebrio molitor]|uniref:Uncharacterized protein n=1 Tax=Tenebrio molitor TaxID=7067 RepID=A0A8J6HNY4_TENMO|nr:hypothetical protein GEV33_000586 [Tenebrio molitor]
MNTRKDLVFLRSGGLTARRYIDEILERQVIPRANVVDKILFLCKALVEERVNFPQYAKAYSKPATTFGRQEEATPDINITIAALEIIYFWINGFNGGQISIQDEGRSGRPDMVTTTDIVEKFHGIVMEDRRVKVGEIAEVACISSERVYQILHEKLPMKKLLHVGCPQCLAIFNRNSQEFFRRFMTVDETWIQHYALESKQQSKQWTMVGERVPKKAKTVLSAGKIKATVFWDS